MRARLNMLIAGQVLSERTLQRAYWFTAAWAKPKRQADEGGEGRPSTTSRNGCSGLVTFRAPPA